jgi:hypothetical protein
VIAHLQVLPRIWFRPAPLLCLAGLLGTLVLGHERLDSGTFSSTFYVVAFLAVALCLHVCTQTERAAWARGTGYRDGLLIVSCAVVFVLLNTSMHLTNGGLLDLAWTNTVGRSFAHLTALAFLARRTPGSAAARTAAFFFLATALPALIPSLRPLLDASPSFHPGLFARPAATWAPILTLVLTGLAIPSVPSPMGTSSP